jgi:hypothetical protein
LYGEDKIRGRKKSSRRDIILPYRNDTFTGLLSQEEIAALAQISWGNDRRRGEPASYLCPRDDKNNRVHHFLVAGWQTYLDDPEAGDRKIANRMDGKDVRLMWPNLGLVFASVLGDLPEEKRVAIYAALLRRYLNSPKIRNGKWHWTETDRVKALEICQVPVAKNVDEVSETDLNPDLERTSPDTAMSLENSVSQTNDSLSSNVNDQDSLFAEVESELALEGGFDPENDEDARHRVFREIVQRRGQPQFRANVLAAYRNRCAVTKCSVVEVLEAAHIRPYNGEHTNDPRNGLLLRADIHLLFDQNLIGINPKTMNVVLSDKVKKSNLYKNYDNRPLRLPEKPNEHLRPSSTCVEWRWQQFCTANGIASGPTS